MDIILASKSPRRREILENTKVRFSVKESQIDEIIKVNESPKETVMRLAYEKALEVANSNKDSLVIGADTIVVINEQILGKPKNEEEAYNMIKLLSGKTHYVITGFALINLSLNKKVIDCEVSQVTFKELSEECIKDYINTKESLDKAGAYGIQGYGGAFIEGINGCYYNVVGLPLNLLNKMLRKVK